VAFGASVGGSNSTRAGGLTAAASAAAFSSSSPFGSNLCRAAHITAFSQAPTRCAPIDGSFFAFPRTFRLLIFLLMSPFSQFIPSQRSGGHCPRV
jgi:hypothetical protein